MKPGRALAQAQAAHWRRQPGTRRHGRRREPCSGLATSAAAESECRRRAQQPLLGRPGKREDRWQGPLAGSQAAPGPAAHWPELRLLIGRPGPGGAVLARELRVSVSAWQYYGMIRAKKRKANLKPAAEQ